MVADSRGRRGQGAAQQRLAVAKHAAGERRIEIAGVVAQGEHGRLPRQSEHDGAAVVRLVGQRREVPGRLVGDGHHHPGRREHRADLRGS